MVDLVSLRLRLHSLVVFRSLLEDSVIQRFDELLGANSDASFVNACAAFEAALFDLNDNWSEYLHQAVLHNENVAVRQKATQSFSPIVESAMLQELETLSQLARVALSDFSFPSSSLFVPWKTSDIALTESYLEHLSRVSREGYGIYAEYHVFTLQDEALVPVRYPDPQLLSQLPGYEEERRKIVANVQALLHEQPAVNMLLYGDAGTGKSSTIKALANEYHSEGLRLIEVRRNQLFQIPALLEQLASLPLKFILFIDDLSFSSNDDNFAALKAILEGSVSRQASNTIIAATSNRRHLVKESVSDRFQDDLHESDTRQELLSLSARFGLIVTFQKPDRSRYLYIVQELSKEYGVEEEEGTLIAKAEAFALRAGGRTPRVAKQFVEQLKSGVL